MPVYAFIIYFDVSAYKGNTTKAKPTHTHTHTHTIRAHTPLYTFDSTSNK